MLKYTMFAILIGFALVAVGCGPTASTTQKPKSPPGNEKADPEVKAENADAHAKGDAHDHSGWWCAEHGIPEAECSICSSRLRGSKAKGTGATITTGRKPVLHCDPKLKKFAAHRSKEGKRAAADRRSSPNHALGKKLVIVVGGLLLATPATSRRSGISGDGRSVWLLQTRCQLAARRCTCCGWRAFARNTASSRRCVRVGKRDSAAARATRSMCRLPELAYAGGVVGTPADGHAADPCQCYAAPHR